MNEAVTDAQIKQLLETLPGGIVRHEWKQAVHWNGEHTVSFCSRCKRFMNESPGDSCDAWDPRNRDADALMLLVGRHWTASTFYYDDSRAVEGVRVSIRKGGSTEHAWARGPSLRMAITLATLADIADLCDHGHPFGQCCPRQCV